MKIETRQRAEHLRPSRRRGFTLVEMLVVLALTLVMMTMFASIFQISAGFVSRQKGIAENDQSARILTTVLKNDLQARTMRYVATYIPKAGSTMTDDPNRRGYFYYSENNPLDDTDDVIQFTIDLTKLPNVPSSNAPKGSQLTGRATNLPLPWQPGTLYATNALVRPTGTNGTLPTGSIYINLGAPFTSGAVGTEPAWPTIPGPPTTVTDNGGTWTLAPSALDQPDGDDGLITYFRGSETINPNGASPNNAGASRFAEVVYFLRHGNLYRRVLLIRDPYNEGTATNSQAYDSSFTNPLIPGTYPTTNNFWTDFDYSARIQLTAVAGNSSNPTGVQFLANSSPESSLINIPAATPLNAASFAVGRPDNRFGHDQTNGLMTLTAPQTGNGAPREFDSNSSTAINSGNPVFFGRYTHGETSSSSFLFPGTLPSPGTSPAGNSPMAQSTTVNLDSTGAVITQYPGGSRRGEDILLTNVVSFDVKLFDNAYSESAGNDVNRNGMIDSGAAFADVGHTAATGVFRQSVIGNTASSVPAAAYGPHATTPYTYTFNGVTYNYNNVFDTWYPNFDFDGDGTADVPPYTALPSTAWAATTAYTVGQAVAPPAGTSANGLQYVCSQSGTSGAASPFQDTDLPTIPPTQITDGTVKWVPQAPVQAIQITVKYLDPTQNLLRQVTIVQSLTLP